MNLMRLIYCSTATREPSAEDITAILETAKNNNAQLGVTGLLCYGGQYFVQCLEGNRLAVNETYNRISQDSRHNKLMLLDYRPIFARDFLDWEMGYVAESSVTQAICLRYSACPEFDPYHMAGDSAVAMLKALQEEIPLI